jgi:hypothetical protein
VLDAVARADVGDFMGDDPGQLIQALGVVDQPSIHVHVSAGQGEGIDLIVIQHAEAVHQLVPITHGRQPFPNRSDTLLDVFVMQQRQLRLDVSGYLAPELDLLCCRGDRVIELLGGHVEMTLHAA